MIKLLFKTSLLNKSSTCFVKFNFNYGVTNVKQSGQIFSFVQGSLGVLSHALIRSHFLLKLTNQVPSLCLLLRFAAKLRLFSTVLTTIPKKIALSAMSIFIKISTGKDSPYLGP